jgi:hypothetical protein
MDKITNEQAVDIIAGEGFEYAVCYYCNGKDMEDPKTAQLWDEAQRAINEARYRLAKHLEVDDFE